MLATNSLDCSELAAATLGSTQLGRHKWRLPSLGENSPGQIPRLDGFAAKQTAWEKGSPCLSLAIQLNVRFASQQ